MNAPPPVLAAGAVVWRPADGTVEVLLVHRPKYDDWSFPKGKLDAGEHLAVAAVREVGEETGVRVRLGPPLPVQRYDVAGAPKHVHYWAARPVGDTRVDRYEPNREIDRVVWVGLNAARERLTYPRDRELLDAFAVSAYGSEPLVVLRHSQALPRHSWAGADQQRALAPYGEEQAKALTPLLAAFGVRRVLSSDAVRCTATVAPFAQAAGVRVEVDHRFSEEGADGSALPGRVSRLLGSDVPLVVCSHRPVLPALFDLLGVPDPRLDPGGLLVAHRQGRRVVTTEHHEP